MNYEMVVYAAVAVNAVSVLFVLLMMLVAILTVLRTAAPNLDTMSKCLPRVLEIVKNTEIPVQVILALCDEVGLSMKDLRYHYVKDSGEREQIVEKSLGTEGVVKRFIKSKPDFISKGYAGEQTIIAQK